MSPQFQAAQAILKKIKNYNPSHDTPKHSFWRLLEAQANKFTQSGVLSEDERRIFEKNLQQKS